MTNPKCFFVRSSNYALLMNQWTGNRPTHTISLDTATKIATIETPECFGTATIYETRHGNWFMLFGTAGEGTSYWRRLHCGGCSRWPVRSGRRAYSTWP